MVYGDNKGHTYEKKIAQFMKEKQVQLSKEVAGSSADVDLEFLYKGKKYSLELKENVKKPDWGQVGVNYNSNKWEWSSAAKNKKEIIKVYNKLEHEGSVGVLNFLNSKFIPNKGRVEKIGEKERNEDVKLLEKFLPVESDTIKKFYAKTDYLQVGDGYGLYHFNSDVAGIGTDEITAEFDLRLRLKAHHNHHNRCPKCKGRHQGAYKKCKTCGLKLRIDVSKKCNDCGADVKYSEFIHVYDNYSFFAVLKCKSISKKSKLNIEPFEGQKFPPIIN
jgi:hypothetical protein